MVHYRKTPSRAQLKLRSTLMLFLALNIGVAVWARPMEPSTSAMARFNQRQEQSYVDFAEKQEIITKLDGYLYDVNVKRASVKSANQPAREELENQAAKVEALIKKVSEE